MAFKNSPAPSSYSVEWKCSKPFIRMVCLIQDSPTTNARSRPKPLLLIGTPGVEGWNRFSRRRAGGFAPTADVRIDRACERDLFLLRIHLDRQVADGR